MTLHKWLFDFYSSRSQRFNDKGMLVGERLGQAFCNDFIKDSWPELFYCEDEGKCVKMITQWLNDCQYHDSLPVKVRGCKAVC